jgi:hypothetical protein
MIAVPNPTLTRDCAGNVHNIPTVWINGMRADYELVPADTTASESAQPFNICGVVLTRASAGSTAFIESQYPSLCLQQFLGYDFTYSHAKRIFILKRPGSRAVGA